MTVPDSGFGPGPARIKGKRWRICLLALTASLLINPCCFGEDFSAALKKPVQRSIDTRIATQKSLDQWEKERSRLMERYETLQQEQEMFTDQLTDLNKRVSSQQALNESLTARINEARNMAREIGPFLETVYDRLATFLKTDMPFLALERNRRLSRLRETLDDAEVSLSEKFRKAMEALSIEAEYGNTTGVYQETITLGDEKKLFNVFRLGRMALFCLSLDQATAGYFNVATGDWGSLPNHWGRDIQAAIAMSQKKRPVDLVRLPLGQLVVDQNE